MFASICARKIPHPHLLLDLAYTFSPLVEQTSSDTVILDIEGCGLLLGSIYEIGEAIINRALQLGFKANVAIAQTPDTATHAARFYSGLTIIPPGEEARYLGRLPPQAVDPRLVGIEPGRAQEIVDTLNLWGVRNLRELALLPEKGVAERLGPEGVILRNLARGEGRRHIVLTQLAPVFEQHIELEYPIALLEPLSFTLAQLLGRLCTSLISNGLATTELKLLLKLENNGEHHRPLNLPWPVREAKSLLKLLLLEIEAHPPTSAVKAVSLSCIPTKPRVIQKGLFSPLAPEPEKLELTVARISKLVGAENVGSLELLNTYRPGAFRVKRFRTSPVAAKWRSGKNDIRLEPRCFLSLRTFRPPIPARVQISPGTWGVPIRISAQAKAPVKEIRGKIVRRSGPWRLSGDWWDSAEWARDEWDVAVRPIKGPSDSEVLYRIYRDLHDSSWFIEGVYD